MGDWPTLREAPLLARCEAALTDYLLAGDLAPGDYLPSEQVLCERLGVGRSTLREAVGALVARGLLERRHGVGIQVVDRSTQAVGAALELMLRRGSATALELLEVRRLYEIQAAAWAAERADTAARARLGAALAAMEAAASDPAAFARADLEFHIALAEATGNAVLAALVAALRGVLLEAIRASLAVDFDPAATLAPHRQIHQAIVTGDPAGAAAAMARHLDDTRTRLTALPHPGGETP